MITGISLFVGSIGVMNIMFVSVKGWPSDSGWGKIASILTGFANAVPLQWVAGGLMLTFAVWPAVVASRLDPI